MFVFVMVLFVAVVFAVVVNIIVVFCVIIVVFIIIPPPQRISQYYKWRNIGLNQKFPFHFIEQFFQVDGHAHLQTSQPRVSTGHEANRVKSNIMKA